MGSVSRAIKKVTKRIKKPISKMTKGIAKGIMKVGKATMRGVAKLQNKLGPLGSIAMAIAMPYALSGLSSIVGTSGLGAYGMHPGTGLLGSKSVFLRSIGQVGNAVRTGYQATTRFVNAGVKGITKSITESFSKLGKGNNLWSKVSNGAKRLFQNSKKQFARLKPMTSQGGFADVTGVGYSPHFDGAIQQSMSSNNIAKGLKSGFIDPSQISGQSFSQTGWLTKANPMDKAVSNAINDTYSENVMSNWSEGAKSAFKKYEGAALDSGERFNYEQIGDMMSPNLESSGTPDGLLDFNYDKSKDFTMRQAGGGGQGTYEFTGENTFKSNNGSSSLIKKALKSKAFKDLNFMSLLKPNEIVAPAIDMTLMGDATQQTDGATTYGGTKIEGSEGGSLLDGAFTAAQREKIMTYYKHMNMVGSH